MKPGLWSDDDGDGIDLIERDPRTLSRRNQRRYVRERIVLRIVEVLKRDVTSLDADWVRRLLGAGIDDELIVQEARRMAHRAKVSL
jgi:hypothetical protein